MKEYRTNEELINYLESKGINILDKEDAIQNIERYTYYSIVNTYKSIFKDKYGNYIKSVSFDEIYALFEFDKELKNIILKYCVIQKKLGIFNNTVIYIGGDCLWKKS